MGPDTNVLWMDGHTDGQRGDYMHPEFSLGEHNYYQ
jgi:prepilin-type processing-associated H-X9-DG protein